MSIDDVQVDRDFTFNTIEEALEDLRAGKMIVVLDGEDRENEGDIVCAAETITSAQVNFIIKEARGLLCVPMSEERLRRLGLDLMVRDNTTSLGTAFTVSVDAKRGTTTGISAQDRAITIRALAAADTRPEDFARPGHVFPLRAVAGGVLRRPGHTEAVVDLMLLAGRVPVGVLCEILEDDGTMARPPHLMRFAQKHQLKVTTIAALTAYRFRRDQLVRRITTTRLPTRYGEFQLHLYRSTVDEFDHVVLTKGDLTPGEPVLARLHSSCLTGDILGSLRCDCGQQTQEALRRIEKEGRGVFLYMTQEGRGIGLGNKIRSYALQDEGLDTVEANLHLGFRPDERDYGIGAQILADLGATRVRLLTNNPAKSRGLEAYGIEVVERLPLIVGQNSANARYLATKREKLGHLLDAADLEVVLDTPRSGEVPSPPEKESRS
jgi:3,4-dihydroxy 2-butanone 4-phosphate synthase / GTP cyclohydrolase II